MNEYLFMKKIPVSWEIVPFIQLLDKKSPLMNGIYKSEEYHGSGIKIINMKEIFAFDHISNQDMELLELDEKEMSKYTLRKGDLIFARRSLKLEGSGKCSIIGDIKEPITFESSIIRARINSQKANPLFYYYLFQSPLGRGLILSIATQTGVAGIRGSDLKKLKVPFPPVEIQNKIVNLIHSYNKILIMNNKRIKHILTYTLNLMQKIIFDPFVAQNIGKPMLESTEMNSFSKFNQQNTINIISDNISEYGGEKEYYATANVIGTEIIKSNETYYFDEKPSRAQKLPELNSIWFARMKESLKVIAFTEINQEFMNRSMLSSGFMGLKTEKEYLSYLYFYILSEFFNMLKDNYTTGATQMSLTNANFKQMPFLWPNQKIIEKFETVARPALDLLIDIQNTNQDLLQFQNELIRVMFHDSYDKHIVEGINI